MQEEDVLSLQSSALWVGQIISESSSGSPAEYKTITISLCLTPGVSNPTGFGAILNSPPIMLTGNCNAASKEVVFRELFSQENFNSKTYMGTVVKKPDGVWVIGSWRDTKGLGGQFAIRKEEDNPDLFVSGVWVGEALPHPELSPFFVPTNPIRWCVTVIFNTEEKPNVFGAGYFDDSGDIPGKTTLFYSLEGQYDHQTKKLGLTKIYELEPATKGIVITYEGELQLDSNKVYWIKGDWKFPMAGYYGSFNCRRQPPDLISPHICLCVLCQKAIMPGQTRWTCATCYTPWHCCAVCQTTTTGQNHPHPLFPETTYALTIAKGKSSALLVLDAFQKFSNRPFIGFRSSAERDTFTWLSYSNVYPSVLDCVYGLRHSEIPPQSVVLFMCDLSQVYLVAILGALMHNCVLVPIHGVMENEAISRVIEKTKPLICFVDQAYFKKYVEIIANFGHIPTCIIKEKELNYTEADDPAKITNFMDASTFLGIGKKVRAGNMSVQVLPSPREELRAILYTSGSTGFPKGSIFTEDLILPTEGTTILYPFIRLDFQSFDPSFILSLLSTLQCGGSRAFATHLDRLMEDIKLSRPTHIGATPLFWNSLYLDYRSRILERVKKEGTLQQSQRDTIEAEIAEEMRAKLGNRLSVASSGGAAISEQVLNFVKKQLKVDIVDLYGSRETGGITRDGKVYKGIDVKVISVPELGYYSHHDPPTGEVCVHSPRIIPGYYNDDAENAQNFITLDNKRYYRTGDIGQLITQGSTQFLKIIDRTKFFFKLSGGEWISPARIEDILENCIWIDQAFVTGLPSYSVPVAIIVPSKLLSEYYPQPHLDLEKCKHKILQELRFWARHNHLRPIEIPQEIHIEFEHWTVENGMLTSTIKKVRQALTKRYRGVIDSLYKNLEKTEPVKPINIEENESIFTELKDSIEKVISFKIPDIKSLKDNQFTDIGGDSLAAAKLTNLLNNKGFQITSEDLFQYPFGHLAKIMEQQKQGLIINPIIAEIDWKNEWTLPSDLPQLHKREPGQRNDIFITGCTGFLGPVLIHQILSLYPQDSLLYCLIRGENTNQVSHRLENDLKKAGLWDPTYSNRLVPLCGSLEQPQFGLSNEIYHKLISDVSTIYHNGALVNMRLPYSVLKSPNVNGTLSIIRLGLSAGAVVHYVSSVASIPSRPFTEEQFVELSPMEMSQKEGYGQSKVIAERLLYQAHQQHNLDLYIYRPSTISGHTQTGFSNLMDFTNLLLKTVCLLRIAPVHSLYLNYIPVDFVAYLMTYSAINSLKLPNKPRIFHITGEGGPTLEQIIKQIEKKKDIKIKRVPYEQWKEAINKIDESSGAVFSVREILNKIGQKEGSMSYLVKTKTNEWLQANQLIWPHLDDIIINKSLDYLEKEKFLL